MLLMKVSVLYMIYLDNVATTKPNQAVLDSFLKVSEKAYYNANSPHQMGLQSEKYYYRLSRV